MPKRPEQKPPTEKSLKLEIKADLKGLSKKKKIKILLRELVDLYLEYDKLEKESKTVL